MIKSLIALITLSLSLQAGAAVLNDGDGASGNITPITINPGSSGGGGGGLLGLSNYKDSAAGRTIMINGNSSTTCNKTTVVMGQTICMEYTYTAGITGVAIISANGSTATLSGSTKPVVTSPKYGSVAGGGGMSCSTFNASSSAKQYVGTCTANVGGPMVTLSVAIGIAADGAGVTSGFAYVSGHHRRVGGSGDYQ